MEPKTLYLEEHPIGRMLSTLGKSYLSILNSNLSDLDIERNYFALILIDNAKGSINQQELAKLLEIDKVTMLRNIDYLSVNGYINRVKDPTDRRKYNLVLTDKAKNAISSIKKAINDVNIVALSDITISDIDIFFSVLMKIKSNLNKNITSL